MPGHETPPFSAVMGNTTRLQKSLDFPYNWGPELIDRQEATMEWMTHFQSWVALGTLTALEIVLGIDNIIFISILVGRLPQERRQPRPRPRPGPGHGQPHPPAPLPDLGHGPEERRSSRSSRGNSPAATSSSSAAGSSCSGQEHPRDPPQPDGRRGPHQRAKAVDPDVRASWPRSPSSTSSSRSTRSSRPSAWPST